MVSPEFHKREFLKNALLAVIAVLITFGALELYVRLRYEHHDLYAYTGRRFGDAVPHPMGRWAVVDAFCAFRPKAGAYGLAGGRKTVNAHGFISTPDINPAKDSGTLRIVFLGGSSTAGTGKDLPDVETWPWKTLELLREKFPGRSFDFINAASGGYSMFESYGRLWSRIRFFEPDIVVVCHAWNDFKYFNEGENIIRRCMLSDGSWSFDRTPQPVPWLEPVWLDPLLAWSQLGVRLRLLIWPPPEIGEVGSAGAKSKKQLRPSYDRRGLDIYRTNLRLLKTTCSVIGAELFVCKQPTLVTAAMSPEDRARCRFEYAGFDHGAHVDAFEQVYAIIDGEMPVDNVIDLTDMNGRSDLFFDHVHPTPEGAAEIARRVAEALAGRLGSRG